MKLIRPKAVLLDLDNTVYEYSRSHALALKALKKEWMKLGYENFDKLYENARREIKQRVGKLASSHSRLLYIQNMLESSSSSSMVRDCLHLEKIYWRHFLRHTKVDPSVKIFCKTSIDFGIPTCLVTDLTSQIQFEKVKYWGLASYISCAITSEEAGCEKPEKKIFELAFKKLRVRGGPIWMVGDDLEKDMKGAKRFNTINFWKNTDSQDKPSCVDFKFKDFREMTEYLVKACTS